MTAKPFLSTMKLLAVTLLLGALVALSHASCYAKPEALGMTHCQDDVDKTWHAVGSKWRNSECYDCSCSGCCLAYGTPQNFPAECESVFNPLACEYVVHRRDDPSVLCPIFGMVGK